MNVADYLDALRAIYAEHGAESPHRLTLAAPASDAEIAEAEAAIGSPLGAPLRRLWLAANGSAGAPLLHDGKHLDGLGLLSVSEALRSRRHFEVRAPQYDGTVEDPTLRDPRVGEGWFSSGWLPFAAAYDHAVLMVDHRPLGAGRPGQVILYVHDPDRIEHVADSIDALLPRSLAAIEADPLEFLQIY